MIELTVKTLDSQNHQFTVEDDITVEQFKARIADKVNIPAETQRIIYCGRVLQDSSKLADYDVNGKVVHLVQRPPPGTNPRPNRPVSPPPGRRVLGYDRGNAVYMGSVAFPGNFIESQGIVPQNPTHSLSGSRLNVARRMLRRAEGVLRLLENPTNGNQQPPAEDVPEEEVTPVIEARVIVPSSNTDAIDEEAVLSAVQNSLLNAAGRSLNPVASGSGTQSAAETNPQVSSSSTPEGATPRSASSENLAGEARSETNSGGLPENASRGTEMAELLTRLGQLQTRFAPYLERYQNFMQEDPEVPPENQRQTQTMLNQVSEVLHFLGHAYHSLSDIIIRVRSPPPRPLLCRPILLQHSAVVQTGIPIQVEAQINLSAHHPPPANTESNTGSNNESGADNASSNAPTGGSTATANGPTNAGGPSISVQQGFVGIPFMPSGSMRVITTPVEIRAVRANVPPQRPNNNNNTEAPPQDNASAPASAPPLHSDQFEPGNNSNLEFFMEVTPEVLRGALHGPPPEFLQNLVQMVNNQIMNRAGATPQGSSSAAQSSAPQSTADQSNGQATPTNGSGQNSQARGNTATNLTTATHTRSTPRPHVQMTQQAMQGGFDPFLPCNSHHISRRRPHMTATVTTQNIPQSTRTQGSEGRQQAGVSRLQGTLPGVQMPDMRIIQDLLHSLYYNPNPTQEAQAQAAPRTASAATNSNSNQSGDSPAAGGAQASPLTALLSLLRDGRNMPDILGGMPTLDQIFQVDYDDEADGSVVYNLVVFLSRNLTMGDLLSINRGNMDPIRRNGATILEYLRTRVCGNDFSRAGIERTVTRIMSNLQPFLDAFNSLPVTEDVDMPATVQRFFRQTLGDMIRSVNSDSNDVVQLFEQLVPAVKRLLAISLYACATGTDGVLQVIEQVLSQAMHDLPLDVHNWTLATINTQLREFMANLRIPQSEIERYIVRRTQPTAPPMQDSPVVADLSRPDHGTLDLTAEVESMDVEELTPTNEEVPELNAEPMRVEESEPLPQVVIGSEPWHAQVPEDWVPIITRDAQKQRRQNQQGPFSDAYLSGMPSKRRKIINSSKPQGSLSQVISESVRQAVTATNLTSATPLETVANAAGASTEIQAAYRTLLRTTVQANLRDNEDFTAERFPNASAYFGDTPQ